MRVLTTRAARCSAAQAALTSRHMAGRTSRSTWRCATLPSCFNPSVPSVAKFVKMCTHWGNTSSETIESSVSAVMPPPLDLQLMISARLQRTQDEASGASLWQCLDCGHSSRSKSDCSKHIEAKHIVTSGYDCSFCGCHYPSRNALKSHVSRKHRSWLANRKPKLRCDLF